MEEAQTSLTGSALSWAACASQDTGQPTSPRHCKGRKGGSELYPQPKQPPQKAVYWASPCVGKHCWNSPTNMGTCACLPT